VRKTHLVVLAVVVAVIVLAIGAVGAFADLASDVTPPTTTTDAAADYWDSATIVATATDDEGVAYIYHELDNGVVRLAMIADKPLSAEVTVPTAKDDPLSPGTHTLKYWAQDINGNVEAQQTLTFTIKADTAKPRTSASPTSVVRRRMATLKYSVRDADPNKGTASVVIKIKSRNGCGKVVKTIKVGTVAVNVTRSARFRCTLAKGTYRFYVYATDAVGHSQSSVGSARLRVK
jgi:hypothetical protein